MTNNATDCYVYEQTEVVLTGRKAQREIAPRRKNTRSKDITHPIELVEVTPKDEENGSWKKFIRMTELYKIIE
jgi:hypothetical protein